jgi:hypothetical protein
MIMKKQPVLSPRELRKQAFETERRELEARVDGSIGRIDAIAPTPAVEAAESVISEAGKRVEVLAAAQMSSDIQAALADVTSSATDITALNTRLGTTQEELGALPPCGGLEMGMAVLWLIAAAAGFFTELKLTDALVMLLGYRRDDPTGRAIGAAFASALLVFEVIVTRLALITPPALLLGAAGEGARKPSPTPDTTKRWLRVAAAAGLVVTLVGVAWLQVVTVIKMAPTRSIYASVARSQRPLTPQEDQILEDSTLFFSVCVLISGGFMAAAGTRELSLWLRRKALENRIADMEARRERAIAHLDQTELPGLAAALESAGLRSVWTRGEPVEQALSRLQPSLDPAAGAWPPSGIRAAAEADGRMFEAAKKILLAEARVKPPTAARPAVCWREVVDDALRRAAS